MDDGMRIVGQRHEYPQDRLEMIARSHASDFCLDSAQSHGTTCSGSWLTVTDNRVDKVLNLGVGETVSVHVTQPCYGVITKTPYILILVENEVTHNVL